MRLMLCTPPATTTSLVPPARPAPRSARPATTRTACRRWCPAPRREPGGQHGPTMSQPVAHRVDTTEDDVLRRVGRCPCARRAPSTRARRDRQDALLRPPFLRPTGVRTASTMYASGMAVSLRSGNAQRVGRGPPPRKGGREPLAPRFAPGIPPHGSASHLWTTTEEPCPKSLVDGDAIGVLDLPAGRLAAELPGQLATWAIACAGILAEAGRPPLGFTGTRPPMVVTPSLSSFSASPGLQRPMFSYQSSSSAEERS